MEGGQNNILKTNEVLRTLLAVPPERETYLRNKYPCLNTACCVSISVRRGDYLKIEQWLPFVGEDFLRRSVQLFGGATAFLIGSDDLPWCRRFFTSKRFPGRSFSFLEESPTNQLYGFALCHHNVISNSTFSWWGAWMNRNPDKITVAPMYWSGLKSKARRKGGYDGMNVCSTRTLRIANPYTFRQWVKAICQYVLAGISEHTTGVRARLGKARTFSINCGN